MIKNIVLVFGFLSIGISAEAADRYSSIQISRTGGGQIEITVSRDATDRTKVIASVTSCSYRNLTEQEIQANRVELTGANLRHAKKILKGQAEISENPPPTEDEDGNMIMGGTWIDVVLVPSNSNDERVSFRSPVVEIDSDESQVLSNIEDLFQNLAICD